MTFIRSPAGRVREAPGPPAPDAPWVVGLDLSLTSTGVAHADGTTSLIKPDRKARGMPRLDVILDGVRSALDCYGFDPDLVAIEGYTFATSHSAHVLAELGGLVRHHLWIRHIPYTIVAPATLKKYATGDGGAGKAAMVVAASRRLGFPDGERRGAEDRADALWLRAAGLAHLGHPPAEMPAAQRKALGVLEIIARKETSHA